MTGAGGQPAGTTGPECVAATTHASPIERSEAAACAGICRSDLMGRDGLDLIRFEGAECR